MRTTVSDETVVVTDATRIPYMSICCFCASEIMTHNYDLRIKNQYHNIQKRTAIVNC